MGGRCRYVVRLNEDEARKDAADREAIVTALREQLRHGDKSLVGNKGYRRYLSDDGPRRFRIDEAKIAEDARYDGKWVLRTNTEFDSAEVALQVQAAVDGGALVPLVPVAVADPPDLLLLYPGLRLV